MRVAQLRLQLGVPLSLQLLDQIQDLRSLLEIQLLLSHFHAPSFLHEHHQSDSVLIPQILFALVPKEVQN